MCFISLIEVPKENWSFGNGEAHPFANSTRLPMALKLLMSATRGVLIKLVFDAFINLYHCFVRKLTYFGYNRRRRNGRNNGAVNRRSILRPPTFPSELFFFKKTAPPFWTVFEVSGTTIAWSIPLLDIITAGRRFV
jgi:hypothetical protein